MSRALLLRALLAAATPTAPTPTSPASEFVTPPLRGPQDVDAATQAYLAQLGAAASARSDAYFEGGYWLLLWHGVEGVVIALILMASGLSARMRDLAERMTRARFLQTMLYAVQYFVLAAVLAFPLSVYDGFYREHRYGLANQGFGGWFGDQLKQLLVTVVLAPVAVALVYLVIRKLPRTWALSAAMVALGFVIFTAAIGPVYLAPLFNHYEPLPDGPIKEKIVSLARANAIPAHEVWTFDASRQTKRMSANVSGLFNTTRISLNDNLLDRGTPEEIQAVMGHEMGHYVLNHVYKFLLEVGVLFAVVFALLQRGLAAAVARWGTGWRVRGVSDVAGLPVLACILGLLFLLATPVTNSMIRSQETEADMYGLNASRQPDGFARAALHLAESRKMKPGPIEELLFFDHPSGLDRIRRSMVWKAEHLKDPDMVVQGNL
ncbi:MAG: M48 family metallopeptidase [Anaeromyxobacteraceae bacterium]